MGVKRVHFTMDLHDSERGNALISAARAVNRVGNGLVISALEYEDESIYALTDDDVSKDLNVDHVFTHSMHRDSTGAIRVSFTTPHGQSAFTVHSMESALIETMEFIRQHTGGNWALVNTHTGVVA